MIRCNEFTNLRNWFFRAHYDDRIFIWSIYGATFVCCNRLNYFITTVYIHCKRKLRYISNGNSANFHIKSISLTTLIIVKWYDNIRNFCSVIILYYLYLNTGARLLTMTILKFLYVSVEACSGNIFWEYKCKVFLLPKVSLKRSFFFW